MNCYRFEPATHSDLDCPSFYTATISSGIFTRHIYAPSASGTHYVGVSASDGLGRSGSASASLVVQAGATGPAWTIENSVICADIDTRSTFPQEYPDDIREFFSSSDSRVNSYIMFSNVVDAHTVSFRWYRPDGTHYNTVNDEIGENGYIYDNWYVYAYNYIAGYDISDTEGLWKVKIYIDGNYVQTETFTVRYEMQENRMAESIQAANPWNPINPKSVFTQNDSRAYTWSKLDNVAEVLEVKWAFYEPNGSLYNEFTDSTDNPGSGQWFEWFKLWGWIDIAGASAANKCGDWRVEVFIKDAFGNWDSEYTDNFRILESPPQAPTSFAGHMPASPIPGELVNLNVVTYDNTYLDSVILYWNDGTEHSYSWSSLFSGSLAGNQMIGPFTDGQKVEYWLVATDTSGNRFESPRESFTVSEPKDITEPVVSITSPTSSQIFTRSPIEVSGTAVDPGWPTSGMNAILVRVNGGSWAEVSGFFDWSAYVSLVPGRNLIEVQGFDAAGNASEISSVSVDLQIDSRVVFDDQMETGYNGWFPPGQWSLTNESSHSPDHAWTDSPGGSYQNGQNSSLVSPVIDLSDLNSATLTFWHRYEFAAGDQGSIWVLPVGGSFTSPEMTFTGTSGTWEKRQIDLSSYAGQKIQLFFQLFSDSDSTGDGWYIDDVSVINGSALTLLAFKVENGIPIVRIGGPSQCKYTIQASENLVDWWIPSVYATSKIGYDGWSDFFDSAIGDKPRLFYRGAFGWIGPSNDLFSSRATLSGTQIKVFSSNLEAAKELGEPFHWEETGGKSVWWRWQALKSGLVSVSTSGSEFDTILAVYTGSSFLDMSRIANNDDFGGKQTSQVAFLAEAGAVYYIAIDGYDASVGRIQMSLSQE